MSDTVEEADLDCSRFRCCGDEDLYPMGCPGCGRLMVFCDECDALHANLDDLNNPASWVYLESSNPCGDCPYCQQQFERYFIRDNLYKVDRDRWIAAGYGHLLRERREGTGLGSEADAGG